MLTPVDCLAFGGNFLHSLNIDMQLRLVSSGLYPYQDEDETETWFYLQIFSMQLHTKSRKLSREKNTWQILAVLETDNCLSGLITHYPPHIMLTLL